MRSLGTDKRYRDNHDLGGNMKNEHKYPYQVPMSQLVATQSLSPSPRDHFRSGLQP